MKYIIIFLFLLMGCGASEEYHDTGATHYICEEDCEEASIDILVLSFGQSNSRGATTNKSLFNERANVFFFDNDGWGNTHDYERIGVEASLGESLGIEYPDKNIGVIKLAVGGTRIAEWLPNTLIHEGLIDTIESAKLNGNVDYISGYFWMQGESDSNGYMASINYAENLSYLISSLRDDTAPFIIGLIGTNAFSYVDNVREAQYYVADNTLSVYTVETNDLQLNSDKVHFTGESSNILGKRFADKFIGLEVNFQ